MSFKDQFNRFFAIEDEGEEAYMNDDSQHTQTVKKVVEKPNQENAKSQAHSTQPANSTNRQPTSNNNVVKFKQTPKQADIKIVEPRIYSEVQQIADLLINGKIVFVHFHKAEEDQAQKMIDFLGGTIYAIEGDMQRVSESMFICAPSSVNIDGLSDSLLDRDRF